MRKGYVIVMVFCVVCSLGICGYEHESAYAGQMTTLSDAVGKDIRIEVTIGDQWSHRLKLFLKITPQIAIWIEDPEGKFLDTLYVTKKFAKQAWGMGSGQKADETYRIESLPYWMHKRSVAGLTPPTQKSPFPDAVTGATPDQNFVLKTKAATNLTEIFVLMELNVSFDDNAAYPKNAEKGTSNYNGVSGQPAVVYRAKVDLSKPGTYELRLIGHSSPSGDDGKLYEDVSTLTTALKMFEKAVVIIE